MAKTEKIKATWVVCGMDGYILCGATNDPEEFRTEAAALKRAKQHISTHEDDEAWVYRLSHLVSRPATEPNVEIIK